MFKAKFATKHVACRHNRTQFFRRPDGAVIELCISRRCWKNVRGAGKCVPAREAAGAEVFPLGEGAQR